jgi:hypothetical protein
MVNAEKGTTMRTLTTWTAAAALALSLAGTAMAKGGTPQNHHCMKDGVEQAGKTHRQCTKDGGKWEKMAGQAAAAPAPAPAPAAKAAEPAKAEPKPAPAK